MTQPRVIGGRYELGELIGYGGMAEVHRGKDTRLGRDVAIKVLRADLARDPSFLARFRREAQAAAGLNHPSIVAVYDTGEDIGPDGTPRPFIVMEYVEGRTLRDILKAEGRLPARRAMEIAADVCNALEFSHRNGLIHRDIKPANVMITTAGAVKVMDFGIARAVADSGATVTQTANVIGTAQYLSPEQARGETVDQRSDVYSTGCLLYELVTGVPPFQGDSPVAVAYQHVRENASAPSSRVPDVPRAIDSIVMKALAKNQLNRYQSAGEMRTDLQRALANQPVSAEAVMTDAERTQFIRPAVVPPMGLPSRDVDPVEDRTDRRRALLWVAIIVALLVVIGAATFLILKVRGNGANNTPTVAVPTSVIGQSVPEARTTLGQLDLKFKPDPNGSTVDGNCDNNYQPTKDGVVCKLVNRNRTTVTGRKVPQGSIVFYEVYEKATFSMPYLVGDTQQEALQQLKQAKLAVGTVKHVNSNQPALQVLDTNPVSGTKVSAGDSIDLTVSNGKVKLPDVTGMTAAAAKIKLNRLGFTDVDTSQTVDTQDQSKDGTVYEESPTPKIAYPTSIKISLTIYTYVAPTTSSTPTCTPATPGVPVGTPTPGLPATCPTDTTTDTPTATPTG